MNNRDLQKINKSVRIETCRKRVVLLSRDMRKLARTGFSKGNFQNDGKFWAKGVEATLRTIAATLRKCE